MTSTPKFLITLLFASVFVHSTFAQSPSTQASEPCLRYSFREGDSLVYKCVSLDTIDFFESPVLYRKRTEFISIVCDHVDEKGQMYLRQTLQSLYSREHTERDTSISERRMSPWIGRTAYIIIDSAGKRILSRQSDTIHAALSPGGAFQPSLIIPLYDSLCYTPSGNKSWLKRSSDTLAENGFPYPLIRHLFSMSVKKYNDSAEGSVYKLIYAETGRAEMTTITKELRVHSGAIVRGSGKVNFSTERMIPVSGELQSHCKLSVRMPEHVRTGTTASNTKFKLVFPILKR